ncbi:CysS/YqeB C-terminal domain-containing protein [Bacillus velezensis]
MPDTPDLEPGANALLKAREKALKEEEKADAKELKAEISKLGITVREKGSRQYWRIYKTPSA